MYCTHRAHSISFSLNVIINSLDSFIIYYLQVCSVLWSEENRELMSGHGMPHNHLSLWKYPCMSKVADLKGHTGRIIQVAANPDGSTVASLGADETLRIWRCFDSCKSKKQKPTKTMEQLSNSQIFRQAHERLR